MEWQLHNAKARFSELVRAANYGPQSITVRGKQQAVVVSKEEYDALRQPRLSFIEFLKQSPLYGVDLVFHRDDSENRDTYL